MLLQNLMSIMQRYYVNGVFLFNEKFQLSWRKFLIRNLRCGTVTTHIYFAFLIFFCFNFIYQSFGNGFFPKHMAHLWLTRSICALVDWNSCICPKNLAMNGLQIAFQAECSEEFIHINSQWSLSAMSRYYYRQVYNRFVTAFNKRNGSRAVKLSARQMSFYPCSSTTNLCVLPKHVFFWHGAVRNVFIILIYTLHWISNEQFNSKFEVILALWRHQLYLRNFNQVRLVLVVLNKMIYTWI